MGRKLLTIAVLALASCGPPRTAALTFTHPSPLLRYGRKLTVVAFSEEGESNLSEALRAQIRDSNAFDVVELDGGSQMVLSGEVLHSEIAPEQLSSRPKVCVRTVSETRTVTESTLVQDPQPYTPPGQIPPPATTHLENRERQIQVQVRHNYDCVELLRSVRASFHVHLRINARTRPVRTIYERDFDLADEQVTTGLQGADSNNHPPAPVDGAAVLISLYRRVVHQFVVTALPRRDSVQVELESCADDRCASAIVFARSGNFEDAERLFTAVIVSMGEPSDARGRERLAPVLFNRGVVRGYATGSTEPGVADITRAIELDPTHASWAPHLQALRGLLVEAEAAQDRGETQTPTERRVPATARRRR